MMKKKRGFFMLTVWWFIIFAVAGALTLFFTPARQRISVEENRVLQNLPKLTAGSLLNGTFTSEFEAFLSDSLPGRKTLIGISDSLLEKLSVNTSEDSFYLDTTARDVADYQGENDGALPDDGSGSAVSDSDNEGSQTEKTVSAEDATFELVKRKGGSKVIYTYSKKEIKKVAGNLEKYAELLPDDGHVMLTLVPFPALARRLSDNLEEYSGWRSNKTDLLNQLTSDKIMCFDTLAILEPHMLAGENLFLYGNHQWNVHGSYYVYCEMIKAQGLTPTPYDEYEYKINRPQNPGLAKLDSYELLYPLAPSANYRITNIDHAEKIPFMSYDTATTSSYLYGNVLPWKKVVTGFHTGRKALVIGDCFDLSLTPFLLPYYDEVHKTDIRFRIFNKKDLGTSVADMIKRNAIDDIYMVFSEANDVNSYTLQHAMVNNLY